MTVNCPACPVFDKCIASSFEISELEYFKENVNRRFLKKDSFIYKEENTAFEMYMVVEGEIKIIKEEDLPYPITLRIAHTGDLIGLEAILNMQRSTSALCMSDTTICVFSKNIIDRIIKKHDEPCERIFKELVHQIHRMYEFSLIMITGNTASKVAQALISLFGDEKMIEITKEEIALMTGSSRETISRILSEMKRNKIIDTNQKLITLVNKDELVLLTKKTKRK